MEILRLTVINLRRLIKNPVIGFMGVILPLAVLFMMGTTHSKLVEDILLVDKDKSEYSQLLINELKEDGNNIVVLTEAEFDRIAVEDEKWGLILTVEKGYQRKIQDKKMPEVTVESLGGSLSSVEIANNLTISLLEKEILGEEFQSNIIVESVKSKSIPVGIISLFMIIYYGFMSSAMITEDMLKLKAQNVLKRAVTTPNKNSYVLIGSFLACFIFLATSMSITYTIVKDKAMFEGIDSLNGYLAVILASFVFIALTIFFVRWFKKPEIISMVSIFGGLGLFVLGIIGVMAPYLPESVEKIGVLGYISPFYWIGEVVSGNLISGVVVLLLMGIAIFTTGTYKLNEFVSNN